MGSLLTTEIALETDVVRARQQARRVASLLGFESQDQVRIATAVSEVARSALEHGRGGAIRFVVQGCVRPQTLLVTVAYAKEADLQRLEKERDAAWLGARRLMDSVEAETTDAGIAVHLRKRFPREATVVTNKVMARIASIAEGEASSPIAELARQNNELMQTLTENKQKADAVTQLNQELQETNRGVVALYAELDEKAASLRRADELKSRFLSDMSHEFRTPLNAILALSRLLLDGTDGKLGGEQERQVIYIRRAAESLSDLVNDLLDLAKVESGKIEIHRAAFDVADLTSALRGMFRPLMVGDVSLVIEDPSSLHMVSDEAKLSQILRNFLSNAVKFTEQGEVRLTVTAQDGTVRFDVRDTGIGIAPEDIQRIFDDFVQVDGPRQRRVRGTGLGLPLSKRLAELIGGRVEVTSAVGKGSTFSLILPDGLTATAESIAEAEKVGALAPVLVVEDEQADLLVAVSLLEAASIKTRQARSLSEARAAIAAERPAAIVLDIRFEEGDAWTFLNEIKSTPETARIPILVMTSTDDQARAFNLGAEGFIRKPVERRTLVHSLVRLLNQKAALRVLHVDDDDAARYAVAQMLFGAGRQLRQASSVEEGLAMVESEKPDVILLDLQFPDSDGYAMLAAMQSDRLRRIPVIMLTSAILDDAARARLSSAFAILSKRDLSRDTLIDSIDAASAIGRANPA